MNSKTAKLIGRFAAVKNFPKRYVKKMYNRTPKRNRHDYKDEMRQAVYAAR